jgi:rare lipoprotein A (peptidoglycan hydrolase)
MVTTRGIEGSLTVKRGVRVVLMGAAILCLSGFTRETATVAIDLPQAIRIATVVEAAERPLVATTRAELTRLPGVTVAVVNVVPVPAKKKATHVSGVAHMLKGMASWYGSVLEGHTTASGRKFDMYGLTAAHRTLPFGTQVRVTDLRNHKSVIVTITDRGELFADRAIDLSYGAAERLDMVKMGVDPVKLDVLSAKQVLLAEVKRAGPMADVPEIR